MESRIRQRIAELEAAEKELRAQLGAVITVLAELRALIAPAPESPTNDTPPADP